MQLAKYMVSLQFHAVYVITEQAYGVMQCLDFSTVLVFISCKQKATVTF
jgi:predicted membrane channel-forming protein YqfA (hemolysin III family)